jgi:hypothetical protein
MLKLAPSRARSLRPRGVALSRLDSANVAVRIEKAWEGRMGFSQTARFDVYVNDKLVGSSTRKWLARAIGEAVVAGHISGDGDTTMAFAKWAAVHDREALDRMPERI